MGTLGKWLTGLIILGIAAFILEMFTPWGAKAHSVAMGNSVTSALDSANVSGITSTMDGNVAKLSGTVASEAAKNKVVAIAQNAQCDNCADRAEGKRWHEVDGSNVNVVKPVVVAKPQSPYTLTGVRTANGGIVLNGYVQNKTAKANLLAAAEAAFPGKVTDNKVKIATGATNANWLNVAQANVDGLSQLDSGRFSMRDNGSNLIGKTLSADTRTAINTSLAALGAATNIDVPNVAAVNVGKIDDEGVCQATFAQLKGDAKIKFRTGSANVDASSRALLAKLAAAANQCSSFNIAVEGHTDTVGNPASNVVLSQNRAVAVVNILVAQGVNPAQLSARGFGDTNPIASNDTMSGKAQNRRIEFTITQSK